MFEKLTSIELNTFFVVIKSQNCQSFVDQKFDLILISCIRVYNLNSVLQKNLSIKPTFSKFGYFGYIEAWTN